jgi:hypothetical protein
MARSLALAVVILYLLMSALFRSFRDSLLVVVALPMAIVGGVLTLRITGLLTFQPMDLLTMIGFITLMGLVVNNAILLVAQTRAAEREGMARTAAVEQAVRFRLRPILMSTLTSLFGMLPLLLMPGAGTELYRGLAAVIVGGLAVSTFFTLVLLPSLLRIGEDADRACAAGGAGCARVTPAPSGPPERHPGAKQVHDCTIRKNSGPAVTLLPALAAAQGGPPPAAVRVAEAQLARLCTQHPGAGHRRQPQRRARRRRGQRPPDLDRGDRRKRGGRRAGGTHRRRGTAAAARGVPWHAGRPGKPAGLPAARGRPAAPPRGGEQCSEEPPRRGRDRPADRHQRHRVARARLARSSCSSSGPACAPPSTAWSPSGCARRASTPAPGDEVVRLVDPADLEVVARAPCPRSASIEPGVELQFSQPVARRPGTIRTLVPFGDSRSHMFELRLSVPPSPGGSGENVRLSVPTGSPTEVLAVPRDALVLRREGATCSASAKTAPPSRWRWCRAPGAGDLVAVTGRINPGDRVVIRGAERLRAGQPVNIVGEGGRVD